MPGATEQRRGAGFRPLGRPGRPRRVHSARCGILRGTGRGRRAEGATTVNETIPTPGRIGRGPIIARDLLDVTRRRYPVRSAASGRRTAGPSAFRTWCTAGRPDRAFRDCRPGRRIQWCRPVLQSQFFEAGMVGWVIVQAPRILWQACIRDQLRVCHDISPAGRSRPGAVDLAEVALGRAPRICASPCWLSR